MNQQIRNNQEVKTYTLSYAEAQKEKSIKQFFGEKYGDTVRVIEIGKAKELCGGTHAARTGTIGLFKILKEHSIAAGIRRIEAASGPEAEMFVREKENLLNHLSSLLKTQESKLTVSLANLIEENKKLKEAKKSLRKTELLNLHQTLLKKQIKQGPHSYLLAETDLEPAELAHFSAGLLKDLKSGIVAIATKTADKCLFQIVVSADLAEKNNNLGANILIKTIAPVIQGGGGGSKISAKAGGSAKAKIPEALKLIEKIIQEQS